MAATKGYEELVPREVLEQVDSLNNKLKTLQSSFSNMLSEIDRTDAGFRKLNTSTSQLNNSIKEFERLEEKIASTEKEYNKVQQDIIKLREQAVQSVSKEAGSLQALSKGYEENSKAAQQASKATQQNAQTLRDISIRAYEEASRKLEEQREQYVRLQTELKKTQSNIKQLDKQYSSGLVSGQNYIDKKAELIQKEQEQSATVKDLGNQIKYNNQIISTTIGSYNNLSAQYSLLKIQLNQLSDSEKLNGYSKQELQTHAKALREEMSRLQKETGNYNLDVGQYDIAVKDLTKTISILDPRIGAIVNKVQAISPLKKTWIDVNNKLATSLNISARAATALQIATVGLIGGAVYLAIKAFRQWREEQERVISLNKIVTDSLNEASINGRKNAQQELTNLKLLYDATQNLNKPQSERLQAAKELQRLYPDYLGNMSQEEILAGNAAGAYDRLTTSILESARAKAYADRITENYSKIIELEEKRAEIERKSLQFLNENIAAISTSDEDIWNLPVDAETARDMSKVYDKVREVLKDYQKDANQTTEEIDKLYEAIEALAEGISITDYLYKSNTGGDQNYIDAEKKAAQDLALFRINQEAEAQRRILSDNEASYQQQLNALNNFIIKRKEAILTARDNQLADERLTESQRKLIMETADASILKLEEETGKLYNQITEKYIKKQSDILKNELENRNNEISTLERQQLQELARQYGEGTIKKEDYEKAKTKIARDAAKDRFDAEVSSLEEILAITDLSAEEREKVEKQLGKVRMDYNKYVTDTIVSDEEDASKKRLEIEKQLADKRKELIKETVNVISSLYSAQIQRRINELEKESDTISKERDKQLGDIERQEKLGIISKEEADAQKAHIDAQAEKRQEDLTRKQAELRKKQAVFERAVSIINIGRETAEAILKIQAQAAILLSNPLTAAYAAVAKAQIPLLLGIAAAQSAAILAQPLPQYKKGTDNHPGGFAIVGDGGRHEMGILPSGEIFKTPDYTTLMNLPKGTQILPDFEQAIAHIKPYNTLDKGQQPVVSFDKTNRILESHVKESKQVKKLLVEGLKGVIKSNEIRNNKIYRK